MMELLDLPGWRIEFDRAATRWAHANSNTGAGNCDCYACQNWAATRSRILPIPFLKLLTTLGIPPECEAEIYHNGRLESGLHLYGGWYHFVGKVLRGERECSGNIEYGPLSVFFHSSPQLVPDSFRGKSVVQLEIEAQVPWLSEVPEMK